MRLSPALPSSAVALNIVSHERLPVLIQTTLDTAFPMPLKRDELAKKIADGLNLLASQLKTRTRASLTDANHSLEFVMARFFNALLGWNLADLNAERDNFPAADLGDRGRHIAMQVTNDGTSAKISGTTANAVDHHLRDDFDRLIIFFLLPKKPGMPKGFVQPDA